MIAKYYELIITYHLLAPLAAACSIFLEQSERRYVGFIGIVKMAMGANVRRDQSVSKMVS